MQVSLDSCLQCIDVLYFWQGSLKSRKSHEGITGYSRKLGLHLPHCVDSKISAKSIVWRMPDRAERYIEKFIREEKDRNNGVSER